MVRSPFKFLDSYQESDKDLFFGREEEVKDLYERINATKLLMVYGASGTGKTSIIECGLRNQFSALVGGGEYSQEQSYLRLLF